MSHAGTCLWFQPEEAAKAVRLYVDLVPNTRIVDHTELENTDQPDSAVRLWTLDLAEAEVHVMGAARPEGFTMAHSMWLVVDDQAAIDKVWDGFLAAGGTELQCGWVVDPFGLSWQVLPQAWEDIASSGDAGASQRMAEALWQMTKIDVAALEAAARGES